MRLGRTKRRKRTGGPFTKNKFGAAIDIYIRMAYGALPDRLMPYVRDWMYDNAELVYREIFQIEQSIPRQAYLMRYALVLAAGSIGHPVGLSYLAQLVNERLPKKLDPDEAAQEVQLKMQAVEGVQFLASEFLGHGRDVRLAATNALLEFVSSPIRSVKQMSILALKEHGFGDKQRLMESAAKRLPADEQFLLDTERVSVGQVAPPEMLTVSSKE